MSRVDRGIVAQALVAVCGIWLMAAPDVLGYQSALADSDHIAGPLLVTIGAIAVWQIARPVRLSSIPVGVWLIVAPWILEAPAAGTVSSMSTGAIVIALALIQGDTSERLGGGWSALWSRSSPYRDVSRNDSELSVENR